MQTHLVGYAGALAVAGALAALGYIALTRDDFPLALLYRQHVNDLAEQLDFLLWHWSGSRIAAVELACASILTTLAAFEGQLVYGGIAVLGFVLPLTWLKQRSEQKRQRIESQTDSWLTILANALRASPSLGEALAQSVTIVRAPLGDELRLSMRATQLGRTLEEALSELGKRVGTPHLGTALGAILIGRETGGNLPQILEETASSLREMERLHGVLRTRTSEGRTQLFAMAGLPLGFVFMLSRMDPAWSEALLRTDIGNMLLALVVLAYTIALFLAWRILAVDY